MMKRKQKINVSLSQSLSRYKWHFAIIGTLLLIVFMLGSLTSFSPYDSSLFYYHSSPEPYHNLFGAVGAHVASLLLYVFGGSAYLLIGFLSFYCWLALTGRSLVDEWDRLVAWIVLIVGFSSLCSYFKWDLFAQMTPGGLIGFKMHGLFNQWLNKSALFFIIILCSCALIILLRFLLIPSLRAASKIVTFLISKKHIWIWLYKSIRTIAFYCFDYSKKAINHFFYVMSGSIIKDHHDDLQEIHEDDTDLLFIKNSNQDLSCPNEQVTAHVMETFSVKEEIVVEQVVPKSEEIHQTKNHIIEHQQTVERSKQYTLPSIDIFIGVQQELDDKMLTAELEKRAKILEEKLERFGVIGKVVAIKRGPVVTVFEYQPDIDSKLSKIIALEDDLALALQALSIRIIAPIPGRAVVGFEVSNNKRKNVQFAKVIKSSVFQQFAGALPLLLGEDTIGNDVVVDLARMPHLLIAGSTGSGKSVALNGMLISLLCKVSPDELKLILIDPKRLEFASYVDIPHLLFPIITDPKKVAPALRYVIKQMEERYELMAKVGARNIFDYHASTGNKSSMPFMVIVIDELADLMMTAGREIEDLITRIAQMARASGIHMLVATQRPSVDVITGLIKVNFPSRISFRVTSKIDSRTILDANGADKLLGRGDMLFLDSSSANLKRIHGAYVSDAEIMQVTNHLRNQQKPNYVEHVLDTAYDDQELSGSDDQLYKEVTQFLQTIDEISISLLQRKFRIGYNRSARIIEMLEAQGYILPSQGGKTRKVVR